MYKVYIYIYIIYAEYMFRFFIIIVLIHYFITIIGFYYKKYNSRVFSNLKIYSISCILTCISFNKLLYDYYYCGNS